MTIADTKLIEQAKDFRCGPRNSVRADTLLAVADLFDNNSMNGFHIVYRMGFIKGQRAAKREAKKA